MATIPEEIWNQLMSVAMEDGKISDDEEILLANIKKTLENYYDTTENEKVKDTNEMRVLEAHLDIMREAYEVSYQDGIISYDELELLKKLQIIVRQLVEDLD